MRIEASRELLAPLDDVWALLAEPYHLSDWWPGYVSIRPDRRGLEPGARWHVVRGSHPGLLRRPGGEGLIVLGTVDERRELSWRDVQQRFDAAIRIEGAGPARTDAQVTVEAPAWRIRVEGLRRTPKDAVFRLHALCQTAAAI